MNRSIRWRGPRRMGTAGVLLVSIASLCFLLLGGPAVTRAQDEIVIGASLPLTAGGLVEEGKAFKIGYELAVEHFNKKGGVLGKQLKLVLMDDKGDTATAVKNYTTLISQYKCPVLLAPLGSSATGAAAVVAERNKVPMVGSYAASEKVYDQGFRYHFGLVATKYFGATYCVPFLRFMGAFDKWAKPGMPKPETVVILAPTGPYGRDGTIRSIGAAEESGLSVPFHEYYDLEATDFTPILTKVKAAKPDLLYAINFYKDGALLCRQIAKMKLQFKGIFFATGPDLVDTWVKDMGELCENYFGPDTVTKRWNKGGVAEYREEAKAVFGDKEPRYETTWGYGAVQVLVQGIKTAGSLDPEKIRDALVNISMSTVWQDVKFHPRGYNAAYEGPAIRQIQKGKAYCVWPSDLAEAKIIYPMP